MARPRGRASALLWRAIAGERPLWRTRCYDRFWPNPESRAQQEPPLAATKLNDCSCEVRRKLLYRVSLIACCIVLCDQRRRPRSAANILRAPVLPMRRSLLRSGNRVSSWSLFNVDDAAVTKRQDPGVVDIRGEDSIAIRYEMNEVETLYPLAVGPTALIPVPDAAAGSRYRNTSSGIQDQGTDGVAGFEPCMGHCSAIERVALDGRRLQRPIGQSVPHTLGAFGELARFRHKVENRGPRERDRLLHQPFGRDRLQRPARLAEADPMPAARQRREVLVARRLAQAVDDDVGAADVALHGLGEAVLARHDHMLATVLARHPRLLVAGH